MLSVVGMPCSFVVGDVDEGERKLCSANLLVPGWNGEVQVGGTGGLQCSPVMECTCDCTMWRCDAQHDRCADVSMRGHVLRGAFE